MIRLIIGVIIIAISGALILNPNVDCDPPNPSTGQQLCTETTTWWIGGFIVGGLLSVSGLVSLLSRRTVAKWQGDDATVDRLAPSLASALRSGKMTAAEARTLLSGPYGQEMAGAVVSAATLLAEQEVSSVLLRSSP
jgi:hypothetical protein